MTTIAMLRAMSNRAEAVSDPALFKTLTGQIRALDTIGDRLIIVGPILSGYAAYDDARNGNWPMFGVDVFSGISGISAFAGAWAGASEFGVAASAFGLAGTLITGAGLIVYAGYQQWRAVEDSNRFENPDTERFLHDVVGH